MQTSMLTATMNTFTQTISDQWIGVYDYIRKGDLVHVGPVTNKRLGIAIERKTISFGYEPDEWIVFVDGEVVAYSVCYIQAARPFRSYNKIGFGYYSCDGENDG